MYPLIIRITGNDEQKYEVWAVDEFSALYDYLREIKHKYENKDYRCLFDEIRLALINEDNSDNCNLGDPLTSLVAYDLNNQLVYSDNYAASGNMKMNRLLELLGEKPDEAGDLTLGEVYLREKGEYKLNEVMDYQGLKIKNVGESLDWEGNPIQGFIIKANCSEIYFPGMNE